jgi:hypothetical protein
LVKCGNILPLWEFYKKIGVGKKNNAAPIVYFDIWTVWARVILEEKCQNCAFTKDKVGALKRDS